MKARPIIMSAESVRAVLAGRKSQTRRVIKPSPPDDISIYGPEWYEPAVADRHGEMMPGEPIYGIYGDEWGIRCPYGSPGDRLWVRETWDQHDIGADTHVVYRADCRATGDAAPWRSPMHMPRWASRITLEIVDVRVERVQDISEQDAKAEGCYSYHENYQYATDDFRAEWDKLNAKRGYGWDKNPYVWVLEFRRLKP